MEGSRIGRGCGDAIFGGCNGRRWTSDWSINITINVSSLEVRNDLRQPNGVVVLGELNWIVVGEGDQRGCLMLGRNNYGRRRGRRGGSRRWDCSRRGIKKKGHESLLWLWYHIKILD
jgi:hypothetical protein